MADTDPYLCSLCLQPRPMGVAHACPRADETKCDVCGWGPGAHAPKCPEHPRAETKGTDPMSDIALSLVPRAPAPSLMPASFGEAMKFAEFMSQAMTIPDHLKKKPADCFMVIEQATRWGLSPFAVAQTTSFIHGRLMYEGKLVAGVVNSRGDLEKRLSYRYDGEGE